MMVSPENTMAVYGVATSRKEEEEESVESQEDVPYGPSPSPHYEYDVVLANILLAAFLYVSLRYMRGTK